MRKNRNAIKTRTPRERRVDQYFVVCLVAFSYGQACKRMCLVFQHYFLLGLRRIFELLTKHYLLFDIDLYSKQVQ